MPSSRTTGAIAASAAGPNSTQFTGTMKEAVVSPPVKRAVPPVGSVWFGPAQ